MYSNWNTFLCDNPGLWENAPLSLHEMASLYLSVFALDAALGFSVRWLWCSPRRQTLVAKNMHKEKSRGDAQWHSAIPCSFPLCERCLNILRTGRAYRLLGGSSSFSIRIYLLARTRRNSARSEPERETCKLKCCRWQFHIASSRAAPARSRPRQSRRPARLCVARQMSLSLGVLHGSWNHSVLLASAPVDLHCANTNEQTRIAVLRRSYATR